MAFTGASLADGQVATSWGTVYGPGGSAKAIVKSADFHNTSATTQTLEIAVTRSGSSRRILARASLLQNEKLAYLTEGESLVLSASDVFEAQTTTTTVVDFTVTGATE